MVYTCNYVWVCTFSVTYIVFDITLYMLFCCTVLLFCFVIYCDYLLIISDIKNENKSICTLCQVEKIKRGNFVTEGFLRYGWKHSENDKENNKSFWSFLIIKFECLDLIWLWELLFNGDRLHLRPGSHELRHAIYCSNFLFTTINFLEIYCSRWLKNNNENFHPRNHFFRKSL